MAADRRKAARDRKRRERERRRLGLRVLQIPIDDELHHDLERFGLLDHPDVEAAVSAVLQCFCVTRDGPRTVAVILDALIELESNDPWPPH